MSVCPSVCPHLHNNHVQNVTLSCNEAFWNNLAQTSILWQHSVTSKNHVPSSKVTLIFWRFTLSQLEIIGTHIRVWTITLSFIEKFKNNFAQMFTTSRWCVMCKTYVPTSKVKVTLIVWRYLCSKEECEGTH
jgi:hypothetical protein